MQQAGARWLVVGAGGMLGQALMAALKGRDATGLTHAQLDITDPEAVTAAVAGFDVVVNAAAYTAVDAAEADEPTAFAVNALGPAHLARACARHGARLLHVSTDYAFDGRARTPYPEDAPVSPLSAYGRSKVAGEWAVRAELPSAWVVRTAWVYGPGGANFVSTIIRLERERDTLEVVDDQQGQPTSTAALTAQLLAMVDADCPAGLYHATCTGSTSRYGQAREIFRLLGADPDRVRPVTGAQVPRPAPRPAYSVLGHDRWAQVGLPTLPPWRQALAQALPELRSEP